MVAQVPREQLTIEHTSDQSPMLLGNGLLYANGGCAINPCGFPGYATGYNRSYQTYRWILQNPVVRLVRAISTAPIRSSYWQYKARNEKIPQARVDLIQEMFDQLRQQSMADILRGRDFGWASFEPLWELRDGFMWLSELKPLSWDFTNLLVTKAGRFAGLTQAWQQTPDMKVESAQGQTIGLPAPYKAWVYSYDKECGGLHGRSWLENIRETAWKDWLDCAQQLQKLSGAISGTQIIVKSPSAQKDAAIAMIKAIANGAPGGWIPSLLRDLKPGEEVDWTAMAELAKASVIDFELLDFGNRAAAISGILARMQHDEELMFAGGLRPSRSGLEGQHGTKAEAGVHTDTGMLASELDDDDIAQQLQPMVDAVGTLNFANYKPGDVFIDPPPLVDAKTQQYTAFLQALAGNADIAVALAKYADVDELLTGLDIPIKEGAKFEIVPTKVPPAPGATGKNPAEKMMKRMNNRLVKATA